MNIVCRASSDLWGLDVIPLKPNEASLTDVQGRNIPLLGKATIALTLPERGLDISLDVVVSDTLGLPDLIVGWQELQRWGVLQLLDEEVPGDGAQGGVFAISAESQRFLDQQKVYPPAKTYKEIDPSDPNYLEKMEVACSLLRHQLLSDVPLAFSDTLQPKHMVNAPPIKINIKGGDGASQNLLCQTFPSW